MEIISLLYSALARLHLEYCLVLGTPVSDNQEHVQRKATRNCKRSGNPDLWVIAERPADMYAGKEKAKRQYDRYIQIFEGLPFDRRKKRGFCRSRRQMNGFKLQGRGFHLNTGSNLLIVRAVSQWNEQL